MPSRRPIFAGLNGIYDAFAARGGDGVLHLPPEQREPVPPGSTQEATEALDDLFARRLHAKIISSAGRFPSWTPVFSLVRTTHQVHGRGGHPHQAIIGYLTAALSEGRAGHDAFLPAFGVDFLPPDPCFLRFGPVFPKSWLYLPARYFGVGLVLAALVRGLPMEEWVLLLAILFLKTCCPGGKEADHELYSSRFFSFFCPQPFFSIGFFPKKSPVGAAFGQPPRCSFTPWHSVYLLGLLIFLRAGQATGCARSMTATGKRQQALGWSLGKRELGLLAVFKYLNFLAGRGPLGSVRRVGKLPPGVHSPAHGHFLLHISDSFLRAGRVPRENFR